ncbi:MAG: amino acid adenylation domain-containing protein [Proteobacteria bacterium]|nr:amino acid adenylation domain-containing protein [Pseudomonadota bacterium]
MENRLPSVQQRFWIDWKLDTQKSSYNMSFEYKIYGSLDLMALTKALKYYVSVVNPFCSSKFIKKDHDIISIAIPEHILNFRIEDEFLGKDNPLKMRERFFFEPFDLEKGPVYRFLLIKSNDCYFLLVCFHHIVLDNQTYSRFLKSISQSYRNFLLNKNELLPCQGSLKEFIEHEDIAIKQIDLNLCLEDFTADNLYVQLFPESSSLESHYLLSGRSYTFEIDSFTFQKLQSFLKKNHLSVFMVIMAAYGVLLKFYGNLSSVSINYPVLLVPKGINNLNGSFINNLLMSFSFSNGETFGSLLDQVKKHRKNAKAYQWLTYPKLIAYLRNQNRIGEHDFANVCLSESLGMLRTEAPEFYGAEAIPLPLETFEPMFDLSFCYAVTSNLLCQIDYDSTKFDQSYIKKFSEYFVKFLDYVIENPDEPITIEMISKNIELVNPSSKINIWPVESSLNETFSRVANQQKTRPALIFEDRCYDYKTLEEQSNQWAHFLRLSFKQHYGREIEPDTLIGICAERNENIIIAILAILKAGAAYVPIDPHYPEESIQHIITDSKMSLVLTHRINPELLKTQNLIYKIPMEDQLMIRQVRSQPTTPPEIKVKPQQLAYIIYTSGSTGKPKGVMISHENVIRLFKSTEMLYQFSEDDVWSLFHSFSFDFSVWEMWGAFFYGGVVQLVSYELSRDPRKFYRWLKDKGVTILNQTPSAFKKLVDEDKNSLTKLNKLKYIIFGGEPIQKKSLQIWAEKYGLDLPKLINMYGITETTVHVTFKQLTKQDLQNSTSNIGVPLNDLEILILNEQMQLCHPEIPGEIYVAGGGLARGYLNRPQLTQERFISNPFGTSFKRVARLYRSGDLGRRKIDGSIEYFGRKDFQIKIRGFRIELGEIESTLLKYPGVSQAVVMVKPSNKELLLAYYKVEEGVVVEKSELRKYLTANLPGYMCPHEFHELSIFPINHNGKMNVSAFPAYIINRQTSMVNKSNKDESSSAINVKKIIAEIWSEILQIKNLNPHDSFFNLGGDSFSIIRVREQLESNFKVSLNIVDLFKYTTLNSLTEYIESLLGIPFSKIDIPHDVNSKTYHVDSRSRNDIAVIGMACRVPGALDSQAFWELLINERSSIRDFSVAELIADGFRENLITQPGFVKRGSVLEDAYAFDAHFFGYSVREAEIMDPQQRQFLECAWEALENSGNIPEKFKGEIGVFASQGKNFYFLENVFNSSSLADTGEYQAMLANEKDFLSTKVSFKLNLTGPSVNVQTGCSSSLVAIDLARQHLQRRSCDMALAGGVALFYKKGYQYHQGMIESPDGYCRAFDENAKGTVAGSGVGVLVLKRLDDAIVGQDTIYAVLKGGAINNDGGAKMNFTAPSINGQSAVIEKAITDAGVTPSDVSYIETHGTGTLLGDPIEWASLHHVYEKYVDKREFCTLGALKTNIGHTDAAAGVLGFIKVVLSLKNKMIPATLNFKSLNSEIAQFNKLFGVTNKSIPWNNNSNIRTAGISSFGIGGTNVHLILQEYNQDVTAPNLEPQESRIIPFSAKNNDSLIKLAQKFQNFIEQCDVSQIENLAFTAQHGRMEFSNRGYFLVNSNGEIVNSSWDNNIFVEVAEVIFHYPVISCQSFSKIKVLYDKYPIFQQFFDQCYQIILEKFNLNIKDEIGESQQLASFSFQYALSGLLKSFGVTPNAIVASGNGPILAAVLSGEMEFSSAIELFTYPEKIKSINMIGLKNLKIISPDSGQLVSDWAQAVQFPETDIEMLKKLPVFKNFNIVTINLMPKHEMENADINLLDLLGRLWKAGISVSWGKLTKFSLNARKISIPTYQYNKKIYKISKPAVPIVENAWQNQGSSPEVRLKELWCKILGVSADEISESTHFVSLGGDSLSAIQLLDQIKKNFSVELLFEEIESNYNFLKMLDLINSKQKIMSEHHVNL